MQIDIAYIIYKLVNKIKQKRICPQRIVKKTDILRMYSVAVATLMRRSSDQAWVLVAGLVILRKFLAQQLLLISW